MTEVLYWTGGIRPSVGPAGAFVLQQSRSFMLIFASSAVFGFSPDFILLENKLIKRTFNIKSS